MGRVYLANAFSPSMLPLSEGEAASLCVVRLSLADAVRMAERLLGELDCAIGHKSTAALAEQVLRTHLSCQRKMIRLQPGDTVLIISLTFRPPEGKIYSLAELQALFDQGRIGVWAIHYGPC
ncbi:MAG: YddF family protein [Desulfurococcales archaeon]|nr:YddF family protein [Desulfurococcales archaeon]